MVEYKCPINKCLYAFKLALYSTYIVEYYRYDEYSEDFDVFARDCKDWEPFSKKKFCKIHQLDQFRIDTAFMNDRFTILPSNIDPLDMIEPWKFPPK